ncbi:heavy-metal-associated domain-containing protein [Magnetospirillum fulvum]|uniref:Copper chaperone n=1 Tax=Magnetospirillum fulvum TaxID=1082 RepID=A0A1H6JU66_MAGFU|nr:heavy-metal-associated domain-containing protein [Magnetospirillum fulvum]SEH62810.1 copper chaperone [Magnetospirillum fulvum]
MSTTYRVSGMTCGGCARAVSQAIAEAAPMATVQVDLDRQAVTVDGADEAQVKAAIDAAGFGFEGRV